MGALCLKLFGLLAVASLWRCNAFPAIIRDKPRSSVQSVTPTGWRVPEGQVLPKTSRRLRIEEPVVVELDHRVGDDVNAAVGQMIRDLADPSSDVQKIIVAFVGGAKMNANGIDVEMTHPDGKPFTANFTQFGDVVEEVALLHNFNQLVIKIKSVGKKRAGELRKLFSHFTNTAPIYIVEADSKIELIEDVTTEVAATEVVGEEGPDVLTGDDREVNRQWAHMGGTYITSHVNVRYAWEVIATENITLTETNVLVVDRGIDVNHEDLRDNLWVNPVPGVGCQGDVHGCNFHHNPPDGDITDPKGHGTHCAGIVAAVTNNTVGVEGCSFQNKIKVAGVRKQTIAETLQAFEYAINKGFPISTNSWGFHLRLPIVKAFLESAMKFDHLFFFAAGNDGEDLSDPNLDVYPQQYVLPNMINVANMNRQQVLEVNSNFGDEACHLAAPGTAIYSTLPDNKYGYKTGTSMATPLVAGIAALTRAVVPDIGALTLKRVLLESTRRFVYLKDYLITRGIPDAYRAIQFARCEKEVRDAVAECGAEPDPDDVKYWEDLGAGNYSEPLAKTCQGACGAHLCVEPLITDRCKKRIADIIEGQCDDLRVKAASLQDVELPEQECDDYGDRRLYGSVALSCRIIGPGLAALDDPKAVVDGFNHELARSLGNVESYVDKWKRVDDHNGTIYVSIIIDSFVSEQTIDSIAEAADAQVNNPGDPPTQFMQSDFGKIFCTPPGNFCVIDHPDDEPETTTTSTAETTTWETTTSEATVE